MIASSAGESAYNSPPEVIMPIETINGVKIFIEEFGSGEPLVLVHGSWVDHNEWPFIVPSLAERFHVIVYDRRGHSQSERLPTQGSVREDVADLAAIIERAGAPAHVLGNSMGASISLRLAAERPELIRTLIVHELPLFDPLAQRPSDGTVGRGTRRWHPPLRQRTGGGKHGGGRAPLRRNDPRPGRLGHLPSGRGKTHAHQQRPDISRRDPRPGGSRYRLERAVSLRPACAPGRRLREPALLRARAR